MEETPHEPGLWTKINSALEMQLANENAKTEEEGRKRCLSWLRIKSSADVNGHCFIGCDDLHQLKIWP